jgi:outer membrane protein assembly factor BamB
MSRLTLLLLWLTSANSFAADDAPIAGGWTRFRGPNGAGVNRSARVPVTWNEVHVQWRTRLPGTGHSSPVVWEDQVFVTSAEEEQGRRIVSSVDAVSGAINWSRAFAAAPHATHQLNSLASASPAVNARHVFAVWGTPERITVAALSHGGEVAWETDVGPYPSGHGFGQSLCLHGAMVVLPVEKGDGGFRIALHQADGQPAWRAPCESSLHYATPCVRSADGKDELIFVNWEQGIVGVDPATGRTNWSADVFAKGHIESSIASPVLAGALVIGVAGWLGHGYEAVAVDPRRDGDKVVWKLDRGAPLCTTPLVVDDLVFFWADNGVVTCVDAATGSVHWRERVGGSFYSSPVCAGDAVFNSSSEGEMVVLAADRRYELLARNGLGELSHATPAVVGDRMYVRTLSQLICIADTNRTAGVPRP